MYHIYEAFFDLNKRFKKLFLDSNFPIKINILSMSKSKFQRYYFNMILSNKYRIISLHLSDLFIVDVLLFPAQNISKFLRLGTLILDNIELKQLENILNFAFSLPNLYSLIVHPIDFVYLY
jgi:hypothetical protein